MTKVDKTNSGHAPQTVVNGAASAVLLGGAAALECGSHMPLWYFVGNKETRRWQKTLRFSVLCALIVCGMFVQKIDTSAAETIQTPPAKVDVNYLLKNPSKIKQQINKENITQVLNDFNRTNKVPLAQWLYTGSGLKPEHAKSRLEDFCNAAGFGYDKKKAIFEAVQSGNYTQANILMGGSSQQTARTTGNNYARTASAELCADCKCANDADCGGFGE